MVFSSVHVKLIRLLEHHHCALLSNNWAMTQTAINVQCQGILVQQVLSPAQTSFPPPSSLIKNSVSPGCKIKRANLKEGWIRPVLK